MRRIHGIAIWHLSFHKREFEAFRECLNESWEKYRRDHGGTR